MIKAILFDCFGVLIGDGLELLLRHHETTAPAIRRKISPIVSQVNTGKIHSDDSSAQMAQHFGLNLDEMRTQIKDGEVVNTELFEWIRQQRTNYKTGLLTNISRYSLEKRFTQEYLTTYFDVQVVSGELGMEKPNPKIYEYALSQLGVEPAECIFIDDRQNYLEPATNLGIHTILFKNNEQLRKEIARILT